MQKPYTVAFNTSSDTKKEIKSGPSLEVLNNLLNFSKSLEVLKPKNSGNTVRKNVEIILN